MKYYTISFPGECGQDVVETWTREQILRSAWYKNWVMMMVQADKAFLINDDTAIGDWCVVHWAVVSEKDDWPDWWSSEE